MVYFNQILNLRLTFNVFRKSKNISECTGNSSTEYPSWATEHRFESTRPSWVLSSISPKKGLLEKQIGSVRSSILYDSIETGRKKNNQTTIKPSIVSVIYKQNIY